MSKAELAKTFKSESDFAHYYYRRGIPVPVYKELSLSARAMLSKCKLYQSFAEAKALKRVQDRMFEDYWTANEAFKEDFIRLFDMLMEKYVPIVDDAILCAAFEMYTKSRLLAKGYVVHEVESTNKDLRKWQKSRPIHVRTIKASQVKGHTVCFQAKTIGLDVLLRKSYLDRIGVPEKIAQQARELKNQRNKLHYHTFLVTTIQTELIDFVEYMDNSLPRPKVYK